MKNVSNEYKAIAESLDGSARYYHQILVDGVELTDTIVEFKYSHTCNNSTNFSVGNTASAMVEFKIDEPSINLENKEIEVNQGLKLADGSMEYAKLGKFKVLSPEIERFQANYQCVDAMTYKMATVYESTLTYPTTDIAILEEICQQAGIELANTDLVAHTIDRKLDNYTKREIIGFIAQLQGKNAIINTDGKLEFIWYTQTDYVVDDNRIYSDRTDIIKNENDYVLGYIKSTYGSKEIVSGDIDTQGIRITNPYMTQDILDEVFNKIKGLTFRAINVDFYGDFRLEVGDIVTVNTNNESYVVPIMTLEQSSDGGVVTSIESIGETSTQNSVDTNGGILNEIKRSVVNSETARSIAEQSADKINFVVEGDSVSEFTITDKALNIIAKNIDLTGKVTFNSLDSETKEIISGASDKANQAMTQVNKTVKSMTMHYLATTASSGVTTSTSGWTTTVQQINATKKYLWTYQTINYVDNTTTDTSPVISGVYGNEGKDGEDGTNGVGITSVVPLYYLKSNTNAPSAPTSAVTSTAVSSGVWTKSVPTYVNNYTYFTCTQTQYTNNKYGWSTVVVDNALTNTNKTATTANTNATNAVNTANTASTNATNALNRATYHYGTCSTAAGTAAKAVTLSGFKLYTGAQVTVQFTNANTAANPTLNVNGTGAKNIRVNNANISDKYYWFDNNTVTFVYDGTYWVMSDTSANSILANWCSTNDKTYIDGGKIYTNSITANKLSIGDFANLAVINPDNYNPNNYTVDTDSSGVNWFKFGSDTTLGYYSIYMNYLPPNTIFNKGDKYIFRALAKASMVTSVGFRLRVFYADGGSPTYTNMASTFIDNVPVNQEYIQIQFEVNKLPTPGRPIKNIGIFLETRNTKLGTIYVRELTVHRMTNNVLIADGAITADKIAVNTITADKIDIKDLFAQNITAGGTITGAKLYGIYAEIEGGKIGGFELNEGILVGIRQDGKQIMLSSNSISWLNGGQPCLNFSIDGLTLAQIENQKKYNIFDFLPSPTLHLNAITTDTIITGDPLFVARQIMLKISADKIEALNSDGETISTLLSTDSTGETIIPNLEVADTTKIMGDLLLYGDKGKYTQLKESSNSANITITLPNKNGTLALNTVANTSANGLMSKKDKSKLDGIGTVLEVLPSAVSLSSQNSSTGTAIASLKLPVGTYMVTCAAHFPAYSSSAGTYRRATLSTTSGKIDAGRGVSNIAAPINNQTTMVHIGTIIQVTAETTYYLNAQHDSSESLSVSGQIKAVRIG